MPTGTGTRAVGGAAVTAAELVAEARVALGDDAASTFSDDELLGYLNEALREYSVHLPRTAEVVVNSVPLVMTYALPVDAMGVASAVCIRADNPPRKMTQSRPRSGLTNRRTCAYQFLPSDDATRPPVISIHFLPDEGMQFVLRVLRPHAPAATAVDYLTVPAAHHHVLVAYILFAAARRLQAAEQAAPTSGSSLLMSQLAANTRRLELAYLNALNRILTHRLGEAERVAWG